MSQTAVGSNKKSSGRSAMPRSNSRLAQESSATTPKKTQDNVPRDLLRHVREEPASKASTVNPAPSASPQQESGVAVFAANVRQFESISWESFGSFQLQTMGVLRQLQNALKQGDIGKAFNDAQEAKSAYQAACTELGEKRSRLSRPIDAAYVLLELLTAARDALTLARALEASGLDASDPRLERTPARTRKPSAPTASVQAKTQAQLPQLFHDGFPYIAGSVVQQYLNEQGPQGSNAIKIKKVEVDKDGTITALEIFRKGSNTKTKLLDMQAASWKGTRLAAHLGKKKQDFDTFVGKLQAEVTQARVRCLRQMRPFPSFSRERERQLALTTLTAVMKALDRVDFIPNEFLRSKPQSVPRVALHDPQSRDLYDKGDLSKLETLTGQSLRYFIDDLISLSLESMFKNRQGLFDVKDVEAFATAFLTLGEPLEDMMVKTKDRRIFRPVQADRTAIEKFLVDQEAREFVGAIDGLLKKVASKSTNAEYKKNLHRTFTLLPFILGGMTTDQLGMQKIVDLKMPPSRTETELLRIALIYGECSSKCVDQFMKQPQHYFPDSNKK